MPVQFRERLWSGTVSLRNAASICRLATAGLLLLPGMTLASLVGVSFQAATPEPVQEYEAPVQEYEAEDASLSPGFQVAYNHADFSGTGFVDYVGEGAVEWVVDAGQGGPFLLSFRFALQSGDRPLDILVNGSVVARNLSFPATGSWQTWNTVETEVILNPGVNRIRARTRGSSGANMDRLDTSVIVPSTAQVMND